MKTFVIGDIHGADRALEQVLERAAVSKQDKLIFLGDYVDGWSGSSELIDRLIAMNQKMDCVFIKGNHDAWCEEWLATGEADPTWLFHGGESTVSGYQDLGEKKKLEHLEFFNRCRDYYVDNANKLFIHAGFSSMHGPEKEHYASNCYWDRTLWETALTTDPRIHKESNQYPQRLKLFKEIYIGHTPTLYYDKTEPMNATGVWNIDTGAAFYGKLSIMDIDTKQFWQSDIVQTLYPDEKGRNKD